jgi:hypothetical protein
MKKSCFLRLRTVNSVRTIIERQNEYVYIPDLSEYTKINHPKKSILKFISTQEIEK